MTATSPRVCRARLRALTCALACVVLAACKDETPAPGGNPDNGRLLLRQFGCGTCHQIPGVADARGTRAPPLDGIGHRVYLAGVLPNTPENMARWIRQPQAFEPKTAMPDLQVSEAHARDMVAYLQQLR